MPETALSTVLLSNTLSADLRLAQAVSEFAQALDDPAKKRFRDLQVALSKTSPSSGDVIKLTEELNREGRKQHALWQPAAGTRVGGFLRRIQQFAASGDVLIGGSQNLIASGVWASVRTMLEASIGFYTLFDQISTLLMKLTTSWYISQEYVQLFPDSKELQTFLAEYLIRVVRLCHKALVFSKKSPAMLFAASLLSSFDAEFAPIQQELDQWGLLIEKRANSLLARSTLDGQIAGAKLGKSISRLISNKSKQRSQFEKQQRFLDRLSPDQETFESIWRRERKKGNSVWVLESTEYTTWKSDASASTIEITGNLGSGKTVAMANIAADMALGQKSCAFFFCRSDDKRTLTARSILGSVALQLILASQRDCKWDVLNRLPPGPLVLDTILELVPSLLPSTFRHWILLDGLEECPTEDLQEALAALESLTKSLSSAISICFSTRSTSDQAITIRGRLKPDCQLSMGHNARNEEIRRFIQSEVRRRNQLRDPPLDPATELLIVEQLTLGAQGMYLWVALQLEAVLPTTYGMITTNEDVLRILHPNRLPKSLPEAFDQALSRITDKRYGERMLQLIAVAADPLTGDQIKVALTVSPGQPTWDATKFPNILSRRLIASCGGSLLSIDEEDGRVRFIHHSVLSHLAARKPVDKCAFTWLHEAENLMGSICVTYLHYGAFDTRVAARQEGANINVGLVAERIKDVTTSKHSTLAHIIRHIKNDKHQDLRPEQFDLFKILQQYQAREDDTFKCLLPYARENWFYHTRLFRLDATKYLSFHDNMDKVTTKYPGLQEGYDLWLQLIRDDSDVQGRPWACTSPEETWETMLTCALRHGHNALFQYIMMSWFTSFKVGWHRAGGSAGRVIREKLANLIILTTHREAFHIEEQWLDRLVPLCLARPDLPQPKYLMVERLLELKARFDLCVEETPWQKQTLWQPGELYLILENICRDGMTLTHKHHEQLLYLLKQVLRAILATGPPIPERFQAARTSAFNSGWETAAALIVRAGQPAGVSFEPLSRRRGLYGPAVEAVKENAFATARNTIMQDKISPPGLYLPLIRKEAESTLRRVYSQQFQELDAICRASSSLHPQYDFLFVHHLPKDIQSCLPLNNRQTSSSTYSPQRLEHIELSNEDIQATIIWMIRHQYSRLFPSLPETWFTPKTFLKGGSTLLHLALSFYSQVSLQDLGEDYWRSQNEILKVLVHHSAALGLINSRGEHGWTPLHFAVRGNLHDAIDLLLEEGASLSVASDSGLMPLQVALVSSPTTLDSEGDVQAVAQTVQKLIRVGGSPDLTSPLSSCGLEVQAGIVYHGIAVLSEFSRSTSVVIFNPVSGKMAPHPADDVLRDALETILFLECAQERPPQVEAVEDWLSRLDGSGGSVESFLTLWQEGQMLKSRPRPVKRNFDKTRDRYAAKWQGSKATIDGATTVMAGIIASGVAAAGWEPIERRGEPEFGTTHGGYLAPPTTVTAGLVPGGSITPGWEPITRKPSPERFAEDESHLAAVTVMQGIHGGWSPVLSPPALERSADEEDHTTTEGVQKPSTIKFAPASQDGHLSL